MKLGSGGQVGDNLVYLGNVVGGGAVIELSPAASIEDIVVNAAGSAWAHREIHDISQNYFSKRWLFLNRRHVVQ